MKKGSIVKSLRAFIAEEILHDETSEIDDTTPLIEEGLLDSFSVMNLLCFIESELGVEIALETVPIERFKNLDSLADFVLESGVPEATIAI